MIDEQSLYDHFEQKVPANICTMQGFEKWYKKQEQSIQNYFYLSNEQLLNAVDLPGDNDYPVSITIRGMQFPLSYRFDPTHEEDGVTVSIPLAALNQLEVSDFDWLVPGLLEEKIVALIKGLPKSLRRNFVPAPDFARKCIANSSDHKMPLTKYLSKQLQRLTAIEVPESSWQTDSLSPHLLMNFNIINTHGRITEKGRNLKLLQESIGNRATQSFSSLPVNEFERQNISSWDFGDLPDFIAMDHQGLNIKGYPALVSKNGKISLRLLESQEKADHAHQKGTVALFKLCYSKSVKYLTKNLPNIQTLCLHYTTIGNCEELKCSLVDRVIATALFGKTHKICRQTEFEINAAWADKQLVSVANRLSSSLSDILKNHHSLQKHLQSSFSPEWLESISDIKSQLAQLIYPGFILDTPSTALSELPRYISAIETRLQKLAENPSRDRKLMSQVQPHWQKYLDTMQNRDSNNTNNKNFILYRWLLEEYRVSLFAQGLGTSEKVSAKRLKLIWDKITQ